MLNIIFVFMLLVCLMSADAFANPGYTGSSGLINVPSAETLDAGNICVGAWSCYGENKNFSQKSTLVLPVSITLGIGTFWEVYGSYPNILFNGEEDFSGRGTLDFGTKLRFLGDRASVFKLAADFLVQRHISENRTIDGATDLSGKLIASYNKDAVGIHVSSGYLMPDSIAGAKLENGYTFGAGVEYAVMPRLKLLAEFNAEINRHYVEDNPLNSTTSMEASVGMQYYLTPHFTLNASAGTGLGKNDPDLKFIFGISSCQGVGSYVNPIPSVGRKVAVKDKSKESLKPLKIIPISSLLLKTSAPQSSPVSKLEVEVNMNEEEILIKPYGQIQIAPQQASSNLSSPVIPVEIPLRASDQEISLQPRKFEDIEASAIDYTMNRILEIAPMYGALIKRSPVTASTADELQARAIDYTMNRIRGITPLFGIDVKGSKIASQTSDMLPQRMVVYRKFTLSDVTFDFDQWTLSAEGRKMLSELAEQFRKDTKWTYLRIDGHTDAIGSASYNMDLSLKRVITVASQLIGHEGIDSSKVFIKGFGKSVPVADNGTPEGRRKNRRTEILLLVKKEGQ